MTTTDAPNTLRVIADRMERQRAVFMDAMTLLRQLTAACPWELDAGGGVAFWTAMRKAQRLLDEFDAK